MIDSKALAEELKQARAARAAAEDAWCEVEELLWNVQRGPRYWRRIALEAADRRAGFAAALSQNAAALPSPVRPPMIAGGRPEPPAMRLISTACAAVAAVGRERASAGAQALEARRDRAQGRCRLHADGRRARLRRQSTGSSSRSSAEERRDRAQGAARRASSTASNPRPARRFSPARTAPTSRSSAATGRACRTG